MHTLFTLAAFFFIFVYLGVNVFEKLDLDQLIDSSRIELILGDLPDRLKKSPKVILLLELVESKKRLDEIIVNRLIQINLQKIKIKTLSCLVLIPALNATLKFKG